MKVCEICGKGGGCMNRKKLKERLIKGMIYLILALALVITFLPVGWVFSTSVKTGAEIFARPPKWIPNTPTLANYKDVLFGSSIPNAFKNSFLVGIMTSFAALLRGMHLPVLNSGEIKRCPYLCW